VFVHYYTHVGLAAPFVVNGLIALREPMADWAGIAYREGEELRARVGPGSGAPAKQVTFELGPVVVREDQASFPISWHASGATGLFPRLNADLTVAELAPELTVLTLQGTYDPPLGVLGRLLDRAGLGLIAEATVKSWLDRVAAALLAAAEKAALAQTEE
jgi:hypothetical protein